MSIDLTVTNTKNNTSSNSNSQGLTKVATIYQKTDATLTVTLVNNTGSSINLAGTKVTIQLPNFLKGSTGMTVSSKPTGYGTASIDSDKAEITIPYNGSGTWNTGSSNEQTFTIENITTSSQVPKQPELMTVVTAGDNFATVNVVLTPPKTKGNIDLSSVIDVSLQSDQILVSDVENPLPYPNKLELTFSNLTTEALALNKTKSTGA